MKLIDLSQPVFDEGPNCPAHPPVRSQVVARHGQDEWQMELLTLATHTGSHLDAPLHKLAGGKSIDALPLETFVGDAYIADLRPAEPDLPITAALLEQRLPQAAALKDVIILLCTGWGDKRSKSEEWLYHSPALAPDGAEWLVAQGIRGVGIDHYSIGGTRDPDNSRTHEILLGAGVWVVEELRFPPEAFSLPQPCRFWSLPINFPGHSGSFCRPVLVVD